MTTDSSQVVFDHLEGGTSEDVWAAASQSQEATPTSVDQLLDSRRRMVVVAAHPDDETLGCGGLMHAACHRGLDVTVIVATFGEGSHPASPTHTPADMARRRSAELGRAMAHVAPTARVVTLGLRDGRVADDLDALRSCIRAEAAPGALVVSTWRRDGHTDHEAVGRAAAEVCAEKGLPLLEYPIWAWHWAGPDDLPWHSIRRVDIGEDDWRGKKRALAEHRSQTRPLSIRPGDEAVLTPAFQKHFARSFETFVDAELISDAHFDRMFDRGDDPWGHEHSWYEQRKRALTLASLPRGRVCAAFEIGCSTGLLTCELVQRAERVLAVDISASALERARRRLGEKAAGVELLRMDVREAWPPGRFDLIVLSEVGYYWRIEQVRSVLRRAVRTLTSDGALVLVHWRHPIEDRRIDGDAVHAVLEDLPGIDCAVRHVEPDFRLDVVTPTGSPTIAVREGRV